MVACNGELRRKKPVTEEQQVPSFSMIPHGALFAPRRIGTLALACSMLENLDRKRKSCDNFEKVLFLLSQFPLSPHSSLFSSLEFCRAYILHA